MARHGALPALGPVLVTGAGGFIGGRLCERLVLEGVRVRALVRRADQAARLAARGIEPVPGGLTRPGGLPPAGGSPPPGIKPPAPGSIPRAAGRAA